MTLARWTPMKGWNCVHPQVARPVRKEVKEQNDSYGAWAPVTDIFDTEDSYVLTMEVPGFGKGDVDIEFKESVLTIKGERKEEAEADEVVCHKSERRGNKILRSFRLPKNVNGEKIEAKLKDGILEVKVAKPEEKKPQSIPINFN